VVADQAGTDVSLDGSVVATLAAGEVLELDLPQSAFSVLETSAPVLAAQYAKSGADDGTRRDPFMMLVVPTPQLGNDYRVSTPAADVRDFDDRLTIVAPTAEVGGIRVNGAPVASSWTVIGASDHSAAHVSVPTGSNGVSHVSRTVPFGVYAYGWQEDDSYRYPGAMRMVPLAGGCTPTAAVPGDGVDNDCDGRIDEELGDGLDQDGDTLVDEDTVFEAVAVNLPPLAYDRASADDVPPESWTT